MTNNLVSFFSLDRVYLWSQYAVYVFGGIALISGKVVNDRQAEKIERLRNENLTLEAAVSDRRFKDQGGAAEKLRKYAGTRVVILYTDNKEAKFTAEQIAYVLHAAEWELLPQSSVKNKVVFGDGVSVFGENNKAVSALIHELNKTDIKQTILPYPHPLAAKDNLGAELLGKAVVVQVGPKPDSLAEKRMRDEHDRANRDPNFSMQTGNTRDIPQ